MEKEYHVIRTEKISFGRFEIIRDTVSKCGKKYPYSFVRLKNSVGILAFYQEKVILIRQYRHALGRYCLEIPGGAIDEEITAEEAAKKELREETGYIPYEIEFMGEYYPTPGCTTEKCSLFLAQCQECGIPCQEPLEYIETVLVSDREMENLINGMTFQHGMGLAAWLLYKSKK